MVNLNGYGKLEFALLLITRNGVAVKLNELNYTAEIDLVIRNITKGNIVLLSRTALIEYAIHQSAIIEADDRYVISVSRDNDFLMHFNINIDGDTDLYSSTCYESVFEAISAACLYADNNKLDFLHSKQLIVKSNPHLFIVGGNKLIRSFGDKIDKIINIELDHIGPNQTIYPGYELGPFESDPGAMGLKHVTLKVFYKKVT
jgi:hypothetical protein